MSEAEALAQLRTIPLFAEVSEATLAKIAEVATPFEVEAGFVLAEHGQPGSGMFVLLDGVVEVDVPNHEPITRGAGEFVGELSLLTDDVRSARVRASTALRGLAISRSAFMDLLHEEPRIALAMLPELARRLSQHEDRR